MRIVAKASLIVAGTWFAVSAALPFAAEPVASPDAALRFRQAGSEFPFDTGALRGTLHAGGKLIGLRPLFETASGAEISGTYGLFSPYRMLSADARYGVAAWTWAGRSALQDDGAVKTDWSPDAEHPYGLTAIYRFTSPAVLDLELAVTPQKDLRHFELFLASYLQGFPSSSVYVASQPAKGGQPGLMEAVPAAGKWQMFPRDGIAEQYVADNRWQRPPNPVTWAMMPRLAAPLAVRRDAKTGLAVLIMAPAEDCFAVATPFGEEPHRSVYLSLFGRDLKPGQRAVARARLVVARGLSDEEAIGLCQKYRGK